MTHAALPPTPRLRDVLMEHVRVLGLSLRLPAAAAAGVLAISTVMMLAETSRHGGAIDFHPERYLMPALLGAVFPFLVWSREDRFGLSILWTAPVGHRHHALTRVGAGWLWLMCAVALFVLWLLALSLFSGGSFLTEETVRFVSSAPTPGTIADASAVQSVRLTAQPLLWLSPFTAATGAYLLASALALGLHYPLRWIVGVLLGLQLFAVSGDAVNSELPRWLVRAIYAGPYGIDMMLSAGTESARVWVTLSPGEHVHVWRSLPHLSQWAVATLLWTGVGIAMLWVAASRNRELRQA